MKKAKKAFTLVEMLVVIVLLTMLIATAVFSYKNMIINLKHTKRDNYKKLFSFYQLRSSVSAMTYYALYKEEKIELRESDAYYYFFEGDSSSMRYITTNPIYSKQTSVASLSCYEDTLVYAETLLYDSQNYLQPQILDDAQKLVLYQNIEDCKLDYIYEGSEVVSLQNDLPQLVHVSFVEDKKERDYYIKVRSNRDNLKLIIANKIYDEN